ncbi:MAG: VOC family protein [Phenylobacterium sp.]|jgi:catechol 2,3-dioxygenase-like lactoylglutathione lyase family enzyme|uniref:VOC family protein n=1 Tax=unclassified Phenylobacterium TaxID=2640670 RepID=UPI0008AACD4F|nr:MULTISPECIES: VOC family protein [unclassified Phenylobacterium]MBA4794444.1 VOC family protein [Phenylobacterium sp.]OHB26800.1 MAG: hypothetical protein A2790_21425 [Phenylobacterium sp. RIFCSPHIGHO2_01_FULL_69_31]
MLDHGGFVGSDLERARRFYSAIAGPLGLQILDGGPEAFILCHGAEAMIPFFWIGTTRPTFWGESAKAGQSPIHVAFAAPSRNAVDAFHQAALAAGGRDNGEPGPRPGPGDYYAAFVLDPDGNNIEACHRGPAPAE